MATGVVQPRNRAPSSRAQLDTRQLVRGGTKAKDLASRTTRVLPWGPHEISSDELLLADLSGAEGARVLGVLHAVDHCWF